MYDCLPASSLIVRVLMDTATSLAEAELRERNLSGSWATATSPQLVREEDGSSEESSSEEGLARECRGLSKNRILIISKIVYLGISFCIRLSECISTEYSDPYMRYMTSRL